MKIVLIATALGCFALPAAAQDYDPSLSAHESMSQQQFSTQQTAIGNHMIRESVRRNRGGGGRSQGVTSQAAQTCRNASQMTPRSGAHGRDLQELKRLCRQAGM